MPVDAAELKRRFSHHKPHSDQPVRYTAIREEARVLAEIILHNTVPSREQSEALTNLDLVVFWANAGVAREG